MLDATALAAVLGVVPVVPNIHAVWVRALAAELLMKPPPGMVGGPLPLWAGGAPLFGGRYTKKGGAPALYLGETYDVAFRELRAIFDMGGRLQAGHAGPITTFNVRLHVRDVLDLCDAGVEAALGTTAQELTGNWRLAPSAPTQLVGHLAATDGRFDALLAPSATAPGARVLVVFVDRLAAARGTFCEVVEGGAFSQKIP